MSSRGRQVPRGVKRKMSNYPLRPRTPQPTTRIDYTATTKVNSITANPHLALAALVAAGLQGLPVPQATSEYLSLLSAEALAARGLRRLPGSLAAALAELMADKMVRTWFPDRFGELYRAHKDGEIAAIAGQSEVELCRAYSEAY